MRQLPDPSTEFDGLYARHGSPSIAPEKLLRASLLQALYSIRSDRGRVAQEGAHANLLEQDGIYRRLFTIQASGMMELA